MEGNYFVHHKRANIKLSEHRLYLRRNKNQLYLYQGAANSTTRVTSCGQTDGPIVELMHSPHVCTTANEEEKDGLNYGQRYL